MLQDVLDKLAANRAYGIHHAAAVLKNHRDVAPTDVTPHLRRIFQHVHAGKDDLAFIHAPLVGEAAQDCAYDAGLAAAALAHE